MRAMEEHCGVIKLKNKSLQKMADNTENSNSKPTLENKDRSLISSLGGILLFIAAFALIVIAVVFIIKFPKYETATPVYLYVQSDSLGVLTESSETAIDSLMYLVNLQDSALVANYDNLIKQKQEESFIMTFGGLIVSVILAIFGFFGYKSFKSIEDKAINTAEEIVNKKFRDLSDVEVEHIKNHLVESIDNRFATEYDGRFQERIKEYTNKHFSENINRQLNECKNYQKDLESIHSRLLSVEYDVKQMKDKTVEEDQVTSLTGSELSKRRKQNKDNQE